MKDTKEMIDIMQAYADGRRVECKWKNSDTWFPCPEPPLWNWGDSDYRIKPEPRTRPMTHRELARWCAEGKGEWKTKSEDCCRYEFIYESGDEDEKVADNILIRSWNETEWRKPVVEG